ncbi:MAG: Acetyltransferase, GNAT family [uncultured Sulfurovum sp.]|uniref:Acetyltransferase, GNAT family n=1 Tax=uncultured Sulfurovum sp. TaxID=269237 RepID=A0A6S6TNZ3_9BACT|nr:MAG: Acetyltransferase, GNAT family [uncultured Sulfurovum sp.]
MMYCKHKLPLFKKYVIVVPILVLIILKILNLFFIDIILSMIELKTKHLILRQWKEEDLRFYAQLTSNKEVMKYFPKTLTLEQSNKAARKFMNLLVKNAWGFWAVEEISSAKFIGYAGLHKPQTQFSFSPCIEIAWRMEDKYWNRGYVLESGQEILHYALEVLSLEEVVYFSSIKNLKGEKIARALGMKKADKNFYHPFVDQQHQLSEHYLYNKKK